MTTAPMNQHGSVPAPHPWSPMDPETHLNKNATFDTFVPGDSNRFARTVALAVAEGSGQDFNPLCIYGGSGLGKTHLSLAIAEGVAKAGHLVMYVSAPHLMDQLELGKFQKDDAALEFREIIFGCDLLVIDDLGTELVTRYTQAEVYDLVNHRLNTGKPTIINTNLGLQEIERTYSSRVHSRLAGMYAVVQFRGRDIRLQKKQEG